jgi:CRISPR/Cas system CMR subunit Cmr6 (Cas7 group RAMP superfamily)
MDADHQARMHNQQRLRQLATESRMAVNIFCSHDAREFQQVTNFGSSGFSGSLIFNDEVPHP